MKKNSQSKNSFDRLSDNELYTRVYDEIELGIMDKAAQARAIEEAGNDESLIRSGYIKHRIENIRLEIELAEASRKENAIPKKQVKHKADSLIDLLILAIVCAGFIIVIRAFFSY